MIAVVTGSRDWSDRSTIYGMLDMARPSVVVHGGARGADTIAGQWADERGVTCVVVPALWTKHGKSAGPKRNLRMLDVAQALAAQFRQTLMVYAFPLDVSVGTAHCVNAARERKLTVRVMTERKNDVAG